MRKFKMEGFFTNMDFSKMGVFGVLGILFLWGLVKEARFFIFGLMERLDQLRVRKADPEYYKREKTGIREVHEAILKFLDVTKDVQSLKVNQENLLRVLQKVEAALEKIEQNMQGTGNRLAFLEGRPGKG
jgi:hypothetical protein